MSKLRVYELAKELGKSNKEMLEMLKNKGIEVASHMSTLSEEQINAVKAKAAPEKQEAKKKTIVQVFRPQNTQNGGRQGNNRSQSGARMQGARPQNGEQRQARPQDGNRPQGGRPQNGEQRQNRPQDGNRPQGNRPQNGEQRQGRPQDGNRMQGNRPQYNGEQRQNRPTDGKRDGFAQGRRNDGMRNGEQRQGRPQDGRKDGFQGGRGRDNRDFNKNRDFGKDRDFVKDKDFDKDYEPRDNRRDDRKKSGPSIPAPAIAEQKPSRTKTKDNYKKKDYKNENEDGMPKGKKGKNNVPQPKLEKPQPKKEAVEEQIKQITIPEKLTIQELADKMKIQPSVIIKKLFLQGKIVTVNHEIDFETAEEIAMEFEVLCEKEVVVDVIE